MAHDAIFFDDDKFPFHNWQTPAGRLFVCQSDLATFWTGELTDHAAGISQGETGTLPRDFEFIRPTEPPG